MKGKKEKGEMLLLKKYKAEERKDSDKESIITSFVPMIVL